VGVYGTTGPFTEVLAADIVTSLTLVTNERRCGPFGQGGGSYLFFSFRSMIYATIVVLYFPFTLEVCNFFCAKYNKSRGYDDKPTDFMHGQIFSFLEGNF